MQAKVIHLETRVGSRFEPDKRNNVTSSPRHRERVGCGTAMRALTCSHGDSRRVGFKSLDKAHITLRYLLMMLRTSPQRLRALKLVVAQLSVSSASSSSFSFLLHVRRSEAALTGSCSSRFSVTRSSWRRNFLYRTNATAEKAADKTMKVDRLAALCAQTLDADDAARQLHTIGNIIRRWITMPTGERSISAASRHDAGARRAGYRRQMLVHSISIMNEHHRADGRNGSASPAVVAAASQPLPAAIGMRQQDGRRRRGHHRKIEKMYTALADRGAVRGDQSPRRGSRGQPQIRALALQLQVREHTVGVLRIASRSTELVLEHPGRSRLLMRSQLRCTRRRALAAGRGGRASPEAEQQASRASAKCPADSDFTQLPDAAHDDQRCRRRDPPRR